LSDGPWIEKRALGEHYPVTGTNVKVSAALAVGGTVVGVAEQQDPSRRMFNGELGELLLGLIGTERVFPGVGERPVGHHHRAVDDRSRRKGFEVLEHVSVEHAACPFEASLRQFVAANVCQPADDDRIVVPGNTCCAESNGTFNAFIRIGSISDEVAGDQVALDIHPLQPFDDRIEGVEIRMYVREYCVAH
jgi:hypothetical protein